MAEQKMSNQNPGRIGAQVMDDPVTKAVAMAEHADVCGPAVGLLDCVSGYL
jgi:hypothetical protein